MTTHELIPLALDDTFKFACHPEVACFNQCCMDLNQALTPYDVLRLRGHLEISSQDFINRYAGIHIGPATGLPVVSLRFEADNQKNCPFVTESGCRVYAARPSSCRIYPLVRALHRSRGDGSVSERYALLQEPHCRGFEQGGTQTVRQWIASQELETFHTMNDALLELIAIKNQVRPGPLAPELQQMVQMAFYDLDTLKNLAAEGQLASMDQTDLSPLPDKKDDERWLQWAMIWISGILFGRR